ncbi:hypothetical protein Ahy_B01g056974 [Arachis hypogaea]|uniref:Uncharacterized protein n=1 Tax=Arachis hypogaea TaxID=3818 RepID=A0A445AZY9_ARAHY|nr:hypothetical protein Ahy_B01g056974 [Arachis hypogaea]
MQSVLLKSDGGRVWLEHNAWVTNLHERKHMWSNAYIRVKLFAGQKTTSRCEALNM